MEQLAFFLNRNMLRFSLNYNGHHQQNIGKIAFYCDFVAGFIINCLSLQQNRNILGL